MNTQAKAPGKLILSGEHAVVHGHPAVVMAVNRTVTTTIQAHDGLSILFSFPDMASECHVSFPDLMKLKDRTRKNYQSFLEGRLNIREVLTEPVALLQFALSLLLELAGVQSLAGIRITLQTDIFISCGMGSSAAVVLSLLAAMAHYLQISIVPELFFKLAHEAETMQHGKSSGLDLQSCLKGGCLYFKEGQVKVRTPPALPFYLINTGQPQTTTGECVQAAAHHFKNTRIGNDFEEVTNAMDDALQMNKIKDVMYAMRENHKLLNTIGVVPDRIQQLIAEIEQAGGGAKISGAGAVAGNHAGAVLIVMEDKNILEEIAWRYQQTMIPVQCEARGLYVHEPV